MSIELKVPAVGESVSEVEVGEWMKAEGDSVGKDEVVAVIETDKATMEVFAPEAGTLTQILKPAGSKVSAGEVVGLVTAGKSSASSPSKSKKGARASANKKKTPPEASAPVMPSAERLMKETGISEDQVKATGPGERILKEDVQRAVDETEAASTPAETKAAESIESGPREEKKVRMSLIRRKIAERLVETQQSMALLTTFNEIDMGEVMGLRRQYQESFLKRYDIKLGFMSFFVKATIEALKDCPALNAEIRGDEIVYRNYFDIGVAIGGGRGLVVPVIRNADALSFAELEQSIADYAAQVMDNKLSPADLEGGTFTITNGGVYGSMLSTPLINAPQSGVLGMHSIQERPVARDGEVVIRPIMYAALTYDHRIVDGREAVTFLARLKGLIEQPARILLEV